MQEIEKILQDAANEQKVIAPAEAWPHIAEVLRKRKRRKVVLLFSSFFIAVFLCSSVYYLYNIRKSNIVIAKDASLNIENKQKNDIINIDDTIIFSNNLYQQQIETHDKNTLENKKSKEIINTDENVLSLKNLYQQKIETFNKNNLENKKSNSIKNSTPTVSKNIIKNEEDIYNINIKIKKTKAATKVKIKQASIIEDEQTVTFTNETINDKIENKVAISLAENKNIISVPKIDSIKSIITPTSIDVKQTIVKEKTTIKKTKKWNTYVGISSAALFLNSSSIFQKSNNRSFSSTQLLSTAGIGSAFSTINNLPNYLTGKSIGLNIFIKKESKKIKPFIGLNINVSSFNIKAYNATNALLDPINFIVDSTQTGNSMYSARKSSSSNALKINNRFMQIGIILGCDIPACTFKNNNKIILQTQTIPSYTLANNIQWYDMRSSRYFTSNKISSQFNIAQQIGLLYQSNIKGRAYLVGPYIHFNYFKLNKTTNNISNIFTQSIGAQFQIKLKK